MNVNGLKIPDELTELLKDGRWPQNSDEALQQNLGETVPSRAVRKIAPEESRIYLLAPPFSTVEALRAGGETFWDEPIAAPGEISFPDSVVIGDFGPGSDSPILLDYREDRSEPRLIRLKWSPFGKSNHWVPLAGSFKGFAEALELWT